MKVSYVVGSVAMMMAVGFAQANPTTSGRMTALLGPDGVIQIVQGEQTIARMNFELQTENWGGSWPGATSQVVTLPHSSVVYHETGVFDVVTDLIESQGSVRIVVDATPRQTVLTWRSRMALQLDAAMWSGGKATIGTTTVTIPDLLNQQVLFSGNAGTASLRRPEGNQVNIAVDGSPRLDLLDLRQWGPRVDLSIGEGGVKLWQGGQTVRYAMTFSTNDVFDFTTPQSTSIQAGPDWIPLQFFGDVNPGSALDFSRTLPSTYQRGRLKVSDAGRFVSVNQPAVPLRFYGISLTGEAAVPDHQTAERLAARLQRVGYNAVRLCFDGAIIDHRSPTSTEIDPEQLDRINYLIYQLGRRGIYVKLELYFDRPIRDNEVFPGRVGIEDFKGLLLVSQTARNNWWLFARRLMESLNIYSGYQWLEDPTIAWISVINEGNMGNVFNHARPEVLALFTQQFNAAGYSGAWTPHTADGAKFGAQLHGQTYAWMRDQLQSIGVQAMLTDVTGGYNQQALSLHRRNLDYVDNHYYWDHPIFFATPWRQPSRGADWGMSWIARGGGTLGEFALSRIVGKPFTVSEFSATAPNRYRAEESLVMGAAASIQNWDGVWRYQWSGDFRSLETPGAINYLNVVQDPLQLAADRAIIGLYLRHGLLSNFAPSVWRLADGTVHGGSYAAPLAEGLFVAPIGTSFTQGDPQGANPFGRVAVRNNRTGEVRIDQNRRTMLVRTPRFVGFFADPEVTMTAGPLRATPYGHRAGIILMALDGRPITTSRRMLMMHLTDIQNTGTTFDNIARDTLLTLGTLPHLVRAGTAEVQVGIRMPRGGAQVFRLNLAGQRVGTVPVRWTPRTISFTADVQGPQGATLYYEIVRR